MYEFEQLRGSTWYINAPTNIGAVVLGDTYACLIDSGGDRDAAKQILAALTRRKWQLEAVYATHAHADHTGGCRYLRSYTGCSVFVPGAGSMLAHYPEIQAAVLYGGLPVDDLYHPYLTAEKCDAVPLTQLTLPEGFTAFPLPGHYIDMAAIRTPDDVVFLADCVISKETLDKYQIGYLWDPGTQLQTLKKLTQLKAALFVPSHAAPCEDIAPLAQYNIQKIQQVTHDILSICTEPAGFDRILQKLFIRYNLHMTAKQHAVIGSTVRSYLSWLKKSGRLTLTFENNIMQWQTIQE